MKEADSESEDEKELARIKELEDKYGPKLSKKTLHERNFQILLSIV